MMNVVELFSGIGAQAKALERRNIDHNIIATCDWDINAIIAYDIIHNGAQDNNIYTDMTDFELNELLKPLNLSANGKNAMSTESKERLPRITKESLLYAIYRTNNLIDITNVTSEDLPNNIDLLTYSFPCQDLSLAGNWHNNRGGIDRNSGNRSSLLWEVERILFERRNINIIQEDVNMPRFLLMENVTAILSKKHIANFNEWRNNLNALGYYNCVLTLDARNFGVPQMRNRTYMISTYINDLDDLHRDEIRQILTNLENNNNLLYENYPRENFFIHDVIRDDYNNPEYFREALESNPNRTPSRIQIGEKNIHINNQTEYVPTITTKQDRHPNSGLIDFQSNNPKKMNFRYLTPRECFILMGFDETDFQMLCNNNFRTRRNSYFFTRDKLNKMAGNSICVNVLESIFELINNIYMQYFI